MQLNEIGKVRVDGGGMRIELRREYIPALQGLEGFGHLNVIWWFSDFDTPEARSVLEAPKPYKKAPEVLGIFATRSPVRPNPLALTTVEILGIDMETGVIRVAYIDANDGTHVLDIKPYTPSADRIETPVVPQWCTHWPKSYETSGDFDWDNEFEF